LIGVSNNSSASKPIGILRERKEATRSAHAAIEGLVPLMDPQLDRLRYCAYLERALGYYLPVEEELFTIEGLETALPDAARREKVSQLRRDLEILGSSPSRVSECNELPPLTSVAEALGCLYVLEGSTLGGSLIARHVKTALNIGPTNGGAFIGSYGESLGAMWRAFGSSIEAHVARADDGSAVIASARLTFATFARWLEGEPATR
jgi:heme oxygenase